ncbi:S1C family serine protease [Mucilaginibacter sp. AW1-3]
MSEIELLSVIERYLNDEMSAEERARFEALRHDNPTVNSRVIEHQQFTERLKKYGERVEFEGMLNAIHNEIDVQALKDEFIHHPSPIVRMWRNHHSKISLAASITIFVALSILFLTGYLKSLKTDDAYTNLRKDVEKIKQTNKNFATSINHINNNRNRVAPSNYGGVGTGFALSSDGYIATNFHVVQGADSVYVQNANGDGYHAKIVSVDPASDLAVLKITDASFKSLGALPYGFKKGKSSLGEDLFTIGYSKNDADEPVYNKGYLSSANGLKGDTLKYQLASMDVNFGNSGGPLLDSKGNIVGVISNKIEGASYAIKSRYLLKAVQSDSLINKLSLNTKSRIANLSRTQQIDKVQNYVFMVKVYNR